MKRIILSLIISGGLAFGISSCKKEDPMTKSILVIPSSYGATEFDANTEAIEDLIGRFNDLVALMKTGQDSTKQLMMPDLMAAWNTGGANSVKANSGWYVSDVEQVHFRELVKNSGKTYHPSHGDTASIGGVFGGRLLDKDAYEILQAVDKGGYAAMFLYQILELEKGGITLKKIDQMLALYGAHPDFANTPTAANAEHPDRFIANYAARRDKNDGTGYYSKIKYNFITLQAACISGSAYQDEKNLAFSDLINAMERSIMATTINYMYATIEKLSKTKPSDQDKADALHDLSEALSFIYGFGNLQSPHIQITKLEIEEVLLLLQFEGTDHHPLYHFTNDPISNISKILDAQAKLKEIYQFSNQEMNDFKSNWVSIQAR